MSRPVPILRRALKDQRVASAWWTVGVLAYCGVIVAVWLVIDGNDDFAQVYEDLPEAFQAMFGDGISEFSSPVGFLSTYVYSAILPFVLVGLGASLGARALAGEEEDGVLELVLAHPVTRRQIVLEKAVAIVLTVAALGVGVVVVLALVREPVSLDIGVAGLASATVGSVLFGVVHGLLALAVGAATGARGVATGVAWGVALGGYLLNIVSELSDGLDWLSTVSPLAWATGGSPLTGELPAGYLTLLAASLLCTFAAVALFERHDLS